MDEKSWPSYPFEWQPLLERWRQEHPGAFETHAWKQYGGTEVRGMTFGAGGPEKPVRVIVAVPHAHEPAPTVAILDLAAQLATGKTRDGSPMRIDRERLLSHCLVTLIPDTNSQGRARSPRRVWDGAVDNEEFLKVAFGEAADGARFGRYPEWRHSEHRPRRVGIVYEQVEEDLWVESNTSRRSTHTRALDELFGRFRYTHYLDMHQHEGDEAALLPSDYDDMTAERRKLLDAWAGAVLGAWQQAGIQHKGSYVPYRGQPRQQFFREYWAGRCPGMLKLTSESRNNRHTTTGEPTAPERQLRSAAAALDATLEFLQSL